MIAGFSLLSCSWVTPFSVGTPISNPAPEKARKQNTIAKTRKINAPTTIVTAPRCTSESCACMAVPPIGCTAYSDSTRVLPPGAVVDARAALDYFRHFLDGANTDLSTWSTVQVCVWSQFGHSMACSVSVADRNVS